jgi:DNA mismatch repair protein MutL
VIDVINLLPDHIANQIAAGEVIQRPASAVKELLENAVDAGATAVHLIIKDAGKELIRVIDNGKGMSAMDARMCFERHATSKISKIEDLFSIRTMGFRGEALASIAAVAQVELKTKQATTDAGTHIFLENSTVISQEPCAMPNGTNIAVKNLFFNVPARRQFLKSNTTELKNIIDEFSRVAMAFPQVAFKLTNNETDVFNLEASNLKQRIVSLLGNNVQNKLVLCEEQTNYISVHGYIGTPGAATKTRGNQYFIVNQRYIRNSYLNHAVNMAYQGLIAKDEFPPFVLTLEIDPSKIDANVHPTKQEIKFDDDRVVYAVINSAVKKALNINNLAPSIDFDLDPAITQLDSITQPYNQATKNQTQQDYLYNSFTEKGKAHYIESKQEATGWKEMYKATDSISNAPSMQLPNYTPTPYSNDASNNIPPALIADTEADIQLIFGKYILYPKSNSILLIDGTAAVERIAYEQMRDAFSNQAIAIQGLLHPITIELSAADSLLLQSMLPDLKVLGYEVEHFGNNTYIIQGIPADIKQGNEASNIEKILEQVKHNSSQLKLDAREQLLTTLAYQKANRTTWASNKDIMRELCIQLFKCSQPTITPRGKKIISKYTLEEIEKKFTTE